LSEPLPAQVTRRCPACGAEGLQPFYRVAAAPAHSVLLMPTREEALRFPRGRILLAFCPACGFITNAAFDPRLQAYGQGYEATQAYSPTFRAFHERLARQLIERYGLRGKTVLEIGCGQGEFLALLCELGHNRGIGFDPALDPARTPTMAGLTFIPDFYSPRYAAYRADFVCCKMTLEHIAEPAAFLGMIRDTLGEAEDTVVFFQVPNVARILREQAFWDIYYEHCSYFSAGSLARLFRGCGFRVEAVEYAYDDQYLMLTARPASTDGGTPLPEEEPPATLAAAVAAFAHGVEATRRHWQAVLADIQRRGWRAALWGGGSKAVAFLTLVEPTDAIGYVVDINPHRQGTFLPGSGHAIVAPAFLAAWQPDVVIIMNPVYRDEIAATLRELNLQPQLMMLA
jgi:SAM-dependent methyltransferase